MLAVPALTILGFGYARERWLAPPYGPQPGGDLTGVVVSAEGTPLGGVEVVLHTVERNGPPRVHVRTRSDDAGRFQFEAPPLDDGYYGVAAGGGEWQLMAQNASLRGEGEPLRLELEPGCVAEFVLSRLDGREVRGGSFLLRSRPAGVLAFGTPSRGRSGDFDADRFEVDGLPPGGWTLEIELDDGPVAEFSVELEVGRRQLALPAF